MNQHSGTRCTLISWGLFDTDHPHTTCPYVLLLRPSKSQDHRWYNLPSLAQKNFPVCTCHMLQSVITQKGTRWRGCASARNCCAPPETDRSQDWGTAARGFPMPPRAARSFNFNSINFDTHLHGVSLMVRVPAIHREPLPPITNRDVVKLTNPYRVKSR